MGNELLREKIHHPLGVIMALKIETGSKGTIAAFFSNTEDQRNDLRWNVIPDAQWSPWLIPKNSSAILLITFLPGLEESPGRPEKAAALTDVAAHALRCCSMRSLAFTFLAWTCSYTEFAIPDLPWWAVGLPHLSGISINSLSFGRPGPALIAVASGAHAA
jgi:hypothetical protein